MMSKRYPELSYQQSSPAPAAVNARGEVLNAVRI